VPDHVALLLPAWQRIERAFANDRSLIIHGPRFAAKSRLLRAIATDYARTRQMLCAFIDLAAYRTAGGGLDYKRLFAEVKDQLHIKSGITCTDYLTFEDALTRTSAKRRSRLTLLVRLSSNVIEVEEECLFLKALHACLASEFLAGERKLLAVVVDDFSLWNQELYAKVTSEMYRFERLYLQPLSLEEICAITRSLAAEHGAKLPESEALTWGAHVAAATGGHIGLTLEAIEIIAELGWRMPRRAADVILKRLGQSAILSALQLAVQEDAAGLAETALEFTVAEYPTELRSSRMLQLRRLGILQPQGQALILCPGVIRSMVETIKATGSHRVGRLGKVVREAGPAVFEEGNVALTDDDLVVVHLSDLHIGSQYGFSYTTKHGRTVNPGSPSLVDLLQSDLAAMGLLGRVDAVVVSGDFVWQGTDSEFRVAREVLEALLQQLGLADRLVLCPGNHDITWLKGEDVDAEAEKRDAFDDFAEKLGHNFKNGGACCKTVLSRNEKRRLHLLCLDSNYVENERDPGVGFVSQAAFKSANDWLRAHKPEEVEGPQAHIWMVFHHHIFPATAISLQDARRANLTLTANASEVLAWARRFGVEAILHGHEHQPSVTVARSWPTDTVGKQFVPVVAIGAGSASVKQHLTGPFGRNQYFVLYRRADDTIIRSRALGPQGQAFGAHNDIVI
jgi:predicted MPP superfamily phosphohydrolase